MNKKAITSIAMFFYVFGFLLLGRLLWIQIADHSEMVALADQQQVKKIEIDEDSRGAILDCNGMTITNDEEQPGLVVFPSLIKNTEKTAEHVGNILGLDAASLESRIGSKNSSGEEIRYLPFVAKSDLSTAEIAAIDDLKATGLFIVGQKSRYYSDAPMIHLLGEIGTVTKEDILSKKVGGDYSEGDAIGISGLERIYDDVLKGGGGKGFGVVVDEKNRPVYNEEYYVYDKGSTQSGSVSLTIDLKLQQVVESAFGDSKGACVVLDAQNGDVLAMASFPKYDPLHLSAQEEDALVNKALKPYPPASLFKIFDTAVGLETKSVQRETPVFCNGSITLKNGRTIHCWKEEGHGLMIFDEALSKSCNPAFIALGEKIGAKKLESAFKKWELNEDVLLGYPLSASSSLDFGGNTIGEVANGVLGEDGVMMTPLNLAKMMNVVASGGYVTVPRLVTKVQDSAGEIIKTYPESLKKRVITKTTATTVQEMMKKTFLTGTGASLGLQNLEIAGKTGTSETENVWIGAFLPWSKPKYTVVILVENGDSGVGDGGPILKKICGYLHNL